MGVRRERRENTIFNYLTGWICYSASWIISFVFWSWQPGAGSQHQMEDEGMEWELVVWEVSALAALHLYIERALVQWDREDGY